MTTFTKKKIFFALAAFALMVSIPLTLSLLSQQQDPRGRAVGSTTLSFEPASSANAPISVKPGDEIVLDMYVNPGQNIVTFVRYQVTYDKTKLELDTTKPFELNQTIFTNVEGPVIQNGTIAQSVSIGSDPTKAIQTKTKVGTIHFKALAATTSPITVAFGSLSQALSSGANDQASQNVLSSTIPAYVAIGSNNTPTVRPTTAQPTATLIPQPTITGTSVNFTLLLHGIGAAGDNPNPTGNELSNKNPLHPQRNVLVEVYNTSNVIIASGSAAVTYDSNSGTFVGAVGIGATPSGNYNIKIKTDRYLRRLVPGIQQIQAGKENKLPTTELIAGDVNGDNFLNVLDYNAMLDCGYGELDPLPMADANSTFKSADCQVHKPAENIDIDDNGYVNSFDYNLFLRELSVQNGD